MAWVEKLPSGKFRGGYIDALGRKRQKGGFLHRTAARTWAEDGEEAARRGETYDARDGRVLFSDWADRWWESRLTELSTADTERSRYEVIVEKWGDYPIGAIGSLELQGWIKELGETRKPGTVRKYHALMSVILGAACLPPHRLILENPSRYVTLPALPQGREVYLSEAQFKVLDAEMPAPADVLTAFLAYTGARWGEAAGLHVNRIDWLRARVQIVDVIGQTRDGFHLKAYPKGRTQRWVPLPDHLIPRLSEHVKDFPPIDCGLHPNCPGLVFSAKPRWGTERKVILRQTFDRHIFDPAAARAKMPDGLRLHDLRHSYASWLVQLGVPMREVQYLLGHASITTTERYSHFAPEVGDGARKALDRGKIRGNESVKRTH